VNGPLPRSRGAVVCGTSRKWLVAALVAWAALALPGFGLLVSSAARADDAHASGSHAAGAGHHVEIGHNPPEGVSHEEFESPVDWRRTDLALWSLAVFVLLLGLLGQFAWKPIMAGLDKREEGIESRIAETKKASEDAKQMLATYERRLAEASDEVRGMLEEARRDADATKAVDRGRGPKGCGGRADPGQARDPTCQGRRPFADRGEGRAPGRRGGRQVSSRQAGFRRPGQTRAGFRRQPVAASERQLRQIRVATAASG